MGYTHYYRQKRDMTDDEFAGFCEDVQALHAALPPTIGKFVELYGATAGEDSAQATDPLAVEPQAVGVGEGDGYVEGASVVGQGVVGFNGSGFEDADHETFWVPQLMSEGAADWERKAMLDEGERFHCTKTARKPYDAMVCACLLALLRRAPTAWKVGSDGDVGAWAAPYRFAVDTLGSLDFPLDKVSSFARDEEGLAKAMELPGWLQAKRDRLALEGDAGERRGGEAKKPAL